MNNIKKINLIKKENLSAEYYFQSIVQDALRLNVLTDTEVENIQIQSLELLAKQIELFTGGNSSSLKEETAQGILQSILYSIGIYLKSLSDADFSIELLKEKPLHELLHLGKELLEMQMDNAKHLFTEIQTNSIVTDNCAYNDTLENIPDFFRDYDVNFAAQDTPVSIDYPLSNDKMDLVGIEYMSGYLQKLLWENQFCQNFTEDDIHGVLRGYHEDYPELLINIFEQVLTNALGLALVGKNPRLLNIQPPDRYYLQEKLTNLSKDSLNKTLQDAARKLSSELNITNRLLQEHISATVKILSDKFQNPLENSQLETIFVSFKEETPSDLHFIDREKMDDELFRNLVNEIKDCRHVSDKVEIIQKEIHSFTDLVDILEGYCIFDDEFSEIFRSLGDMELALLLKRLPTHIIDADLHFTENEKEWYKMLESFLRKLDPVKSQHIRTLAEKIAVN